MLNSIIGFLGSGAGGGGGSYESIATFNGTGSSGSIVFSSIPSTYVALQLRINAVMVTGSNSINIQLNGDTGANYTRHRLYGDGTSAVADGATALGQAGLTVGGTGDTTYPYAIITDILDYASTSKNKTIRTFSGVNKNGTTTESVNLCSNLWLNTAAVNSLTVLSASNFATSTTVALYGIKGA